MRKPFERQAVSLQEPREEVQLAFIIGFIFSIEVGGKDMFGSIQALHKRLNKIPSVQIAATCHDNSA